MLQLLSMTFIPASIALSEARSRDLAIANQIMRDVSVMAENQISEKKFANKIDLCDEIGRIKNYS